MYERAYIYIHTDRHTYICTEPLLESNQQPSVLGQMPYPLSCRDSYEQPSYIGFLYKLCGLIM